MSEAEAQGDLEVQLEEPQDKEVEIDETKPESNAGKFVDSDGRPAPGHPRFNEIYREGKEAERKLEEQSETIKAIQDHNQQLVTAMERTAVAQEKQASMTSESMERDIQEKETAQTVKTFEGLLEDKVKAMDEGDNARIVDIENKILDMKLSEQKKSVTPPVPETALPVDRQAAIDVFKRDVKWFESDPMMRGASIEIENSLLANPEWQGRSFTDMYAEVQKQVETRFGFKAGATVPSTNSVEGANNISPRGVKTVKLSAAEMRCADKMNVSYKDYAKQKLFIEENK